jgi:hypothetical protein
MSLQADQYQLDSPRTYVVRMVVFLIIVGFLAAILFPQLGGAFKANPGLNGLIVGILVLGIGYGFRQVIILFPEVEWVNTFRFGDPGLKLTNPPVMLAPMATMLGEQRGGMLLTSLSMRSLLDSIGTRLDEARDISRYLIGLLIFLGLLGTFWGLLDTINSVAQTIRTLDVGRNDSGVIFEELRAGLEAPLQGMGTAFSSSLFGLSGSLVLGFLDLQTSQAQNRFYTDLEDWLSTVTDISAVDTENTAKAGVSPAQLRLTLQDMQHSIERLDDPVKRQTKNAEDEDQDTLNDLALGIHELVIQMRNEQQTIRDWVEAQADKQMEIKQVLERIADNNPGNNDPLPSDSETNKTQDHNKD